MMCRMRQIFPSTCNVIEVRICSWHIWYHRNHNSTNKLSVFNRCACDWLYKLNWCFSSIQRENRWVYQSCLLQRCAWTDQWAPSFKDLSELVLQPFTTVWPGPRVWKGRYLAIHVTCGKADVLPCFLVLLSLWNRNVDYDRSFINSI